MGVCRSCMVKKNKLVHTSTLPMSSPNTFRSQTSMDVKHSRSYSRDSAKNRRPLIDSRRCSDMPSEMCKGTYINIPPSSDEESSTLSVLKSHPIFKYLNESSHLSILSELKKFEFAPRIEIVRQNDPGSNFFILSKGCLLYTSPSPRDS